MSTKSRKNLTNMEINVCRSILYVGSADVLNFVRLCYQRTGKVKSCAVLNFSCFHAWRTSCKGEALRACVSILCFVCGLSKYNIQIVFQSAFRVKKMNWRQEEEEKLISTVGKYEWLCDLHQRSFKDVKKNSWREITEIVKPDSTGTLCVTIIERWMDRLAL